MHQVTKLIMIGCIALAGCALKIERLEPPESENYSKAELSEAFRRIDTAIKKLAAGLSELQPKEVKK